MSHLVAGPAGCQHVLAGGRHLAQVLVSHARWGRLAFEYDFEAFVNHARPYKELAQYRVGRVHVPSVLLAVLAELVKFPLRPVYGKPVGPTDALRDHLGRAVSGEIPRESERPPADTRSTLLASAFLDTVNLDTKHFVCRLWIALRPSVRVESLD